MYHINLSQPALTTRHAPIVALGRSLLLALLLVTMASCGVQSKTSSLGTGSSTSTSAKGTASPQTTPSCWTTQSSGSPSASSFARVPGLVFSSSTLPVGIGAPAPSWLHFNCAASVNVDGLHIQTVTGIQCGEIVELDGIRAAYDQGTLEQMSAYLAGYGAETNGVNSSGVILPPPSSGLQLVPYSPNSCSGEIDITNTANQPLQVSSVGMSYLADPFTDTYHYSSVDAASLGVQCGGCGAGVGCLSKASITLTQGNVGKSVEAPVQGLGVNAANCPVQPKNVLYLSVGVTDPVPDQVYQTQLFIDVAEGNGTKKVVLPQSFDSTLVFSDNNPVPCLGYNGTSFQVENLSQEKANNYYYSCQ